MEGEEGRERIARVARRGTGLNRLAMEAGDHGGENGRSQSFYEELTNRRNQSHITMRRRTKEVEEYTCSAVGCRLRGQDQALACA